MIFIYFSFNLSYDVFIASFLSTVLSRHSSQKPHFCCLNRFAIEEAKEEVDDDDAGALERDISEEEEEEEELTEEDKAYNEQQSCLLYATTGVISADSRYVVVGSDRALPVVWATDSGRVIGHMASSGTDVATAWVALACDDCFVVGLTLGPRTRNDYPFIYRYQVRTDTKRIEGF